MRVIHCPLCGSRMVKDMVEGELTLYRCPKDGKGVMVSSAVVSGAKRSAHMKELGIETYRDTQGGDLEEDDEQGDNT